MNTSGLSVTALASNPNVTLQLRIKSRQAPSLAAGSGTEYGSCTRAIKMRGADARCPRSIPDIARHYDSARAAHGTLLNACINGESLPFSASTDIALGHDRGGEQILGAKQPASQAVDTGAVDQGQSFFACNLIGCSPAWCSPPWRTAFAADAHLAEADGVALRCAKGARSPEAPTDPCAGMTG